MDQPTPRDELVANVRGMGLVARSAPGLASTLLAMTVISGAAPAVAVAGTGKFLATLPEAIAAGAASPAGQEVRQALLLIAGAVFLSQLVGPLQQAVLFGLQRRFEAYLSRRLMTATVALPGLAYFEDPEFRDELAVAHWIGFGPVHTLQFMVQVFQQGAQLVAMAAVAATYAGWVPVLVLLSAVPGGVASWRFESITGLARWRRSEDTRRAEYYRNLAVTREPGKELRIFSLPAWARARQARHWLAGVQEMLALRRTGLQWVLGLHVVAVAGVAVAYVVMLRSTIDGRTAVGTFTAASIAAVGLSTSVVAMLREASRARRSSFYMPSAMRVLDLATADPRLDLSGATPARPPTRSGIRFEGVSFTYPGTDRLILDRLDLDITAGTSVALVGENGAGKTTLIKLLCRFYDPDDGRITVDGVDIREFDLDDYRSRLAVIFQDFVHYNL
ncbi:MAG TPA: ATP-binding cassette domain-containing protein, partial [Acidimicrobiales bacterium]|nr:ATP-binding cassette domain-containing protein [Acidimicrobiales bacterium]